MPLFQFGKSDAEKARQRVLKEVKRQAKRQRKQAAKEVRQARKAQKKRRRPFGRNTRHERPNGPNEPYERPNGPDERSFHSTMPDEQSYTSNARDERSSTHNARSSTPNAPYERRPSFANPLCTETPAFSNSLQCHVCAKKFGRALHHRRHHCRACRHSCCLRCMSRERRPVPQFGLFEPQKICVVCDTLGAHANVSPPREPADAIRALAAGHTNARRLRSASWRARTASWRPRTASWHSASLPTTVDYTDESPVRERSRSRSKSSARWHLPIRPLQKAKEIAEKVRNQSLDWELQMEKQRLYGSRAHDVHEQMTSPPGSHGGQAMRLRPQTIAPPTFGAKDIQQQSSTTANLANGPVVEL